MKRKGAQYFLLTMGILLILLCFFPFSAFNVYAADYDNNYYGYKDSYIDNGAEQDHKLIFFPLPPESTSRNYMILYSPSKKTYYFYTGDSYVSWYDFWGTTIVNGEWKCYSYSEGYSNSWEIADIEIDYPNSVKWAKFPSDFIVIDSTIPTSGHSGYRVLFTQKTGYHLYWQLSEIFIFILSWIDDLSEYILLRPLLRIALLILFAGELFIYMMIIIRRVGALKNEKDID